jgi:protein-S-isoprenylcysteine O-methyltransferase Ste14
MAKPVVHDALSGIGCATMLLMAAEALEATLQSPSLSAWLCVTMHAIAAALFVIRRAPRISARSARAAVVTTGSVSYAFAFDMTESAAPNWLATCGDSLAVAGLAGCVLSLGALGRSFAIFPADRGLVTTGPYGWVRHPLYASYIVVDSSVLLSHASAENALLLCLGLLLFLLRIQEEERVLDTGAYAAYARRVRHRLLPRVY